MQRKSGVSFSPGIEQVTGEDKMPSFNTYVVMQFSNKIPPATMEWVLSKINAPRKQKGGELLMKTALDENGEVRS